MWCIMYNLIFSIYKLVLYDVIGKAVFKKWNIKYILIFRA